MEVHQSLISKADDAFHQPNDSLTLHRKDAKKKAGSNSQSPGSPEHKHRKHELGKGKMIDYPLSPGGVLGSEDDSPEGPLSSPLHEPTGNRVSDKKLLGNPGYTPFSSRTSPTSTGADSEQLSPKDGQTSGSPRSESAKRRDSLERRHKKAHRASTELPPKSKKKDAKKCTEEPFDTEYTVPKHFIPTSRQDSLTKMLEKQKLLKTVKPEDGSKATQDKPADEGNSWNVFRKVPRSSIGTDGPQADEPPGQSNGHQERRKTFPFGGRKKERKTSTVVNERTPPDRYRCKMFLKKCTEHLMLGLLFGGIGGGLALGHALRFSGIVWKSREIMYLAFPGELLLRMLSSVSLPLMISSVIAAMGSLHPRVLARIGAWTLLLWAATKVMAVLIAIAVSTILKPGMADHDIKIPTVPKPASSVLVVDKALDLLRNLFPSNVLEACIYTTFTKIKLSSEADIELLSNASAVDKLRYSMVRDTRPNQMGLLTFCLLIGGVLSVVREQHNAVLNFFVSLSNAVMIITQVIMWYSPIGVCCLVASYVVSEPAFGVWQLDPLWGALGVALFVHAAFVLPFVYAVFVRCNCLELFFSTLPPMAVGFGTGSNWRSMPVAVSTLEDNAGLDPRLVRLLVPVGSLSNKDGSTIFLAVILCYFAQRYRLPLDAVDYALLGTVSVLGSMSKPSVGSDMGSLFLFVLEAAGIPTVEVSILYLLHWAFDLLATSVNTLGNAVSAAVVQSLCTNILVSEESPEDAGGNNGRNQESIIGQ